MDTIPPELILYLIPFLPLKSLITARGVNTQWRSLAQTASLHPARKALLDVYLAAIIHPNFPSIVDAVRLHVREFDREAYIADLKSRGCVLPDVFELWVLEWPSKAVHFWAWPGLLDAFIVNHKYYCGGGNMLSETTPVIEAIPVPKKEASSGGETCRGIALWEDMCGPTVTLWLVVDANEKINDNRAGRLIWTYSYGEFGPLRTEHPMCIFYDSPFPTNDFFIEFLDLLDLTWRDVEWTMEGYYLGGFQCTDE